jgi:hypothetical protein
MSKTTSEIPAVSSMISLQERIAHLRFHLHLGRDEGGVAPGLYSLGSPTPDAPVFVSTNNIIRFDTLRMALKGTGAYILVLETNGLDAWFVPGKSAFITDELVKRIKASHLKQLVNHDTLILPELAQSSVADHLVFNRGGFRVEYGPERAYDIPEYLETHQLTPEMQIVRYSLWERMRLIPFDISGFIAPLLIGSAMVFILGGMMPAVATALAILAGVFLFPLVLPWLPSKDFSTKGIFLGLIITLPFSLAILLQDPQTWMVVVTAIALLILLPPITSFIALNFAGTATFNKHSGTQAELVTYIPVHILLFGVGLVIMVAMRIITL